MACIKGVNRSASLALAPDGGYMAAGTMAGAVDMSFSSSASIEIFKVDFQSDDKDLPLVAELPSSERFNRLSWGRNGSSSDEFSLGLVAGGLVDGSIDIWNPLALIGSEGEKALVGHLSRHKGPVRGLEFNAIAPNLLASGADDGEICIWDLAAPAEPSLFPPLKGSGGSAQGEISYLSWNSKVQHILASTSYTGTTVVWDLKKQKPVISFTDTIRRRCSVLQWNPDVATQLVVASDEDSSPTIRLWDMRNIMSPVKEFIGHTKGVIAMSWCPFDSSYLLTCAKDNRTICWDTVTGEIVSELPAGSNWNFDVHWYSKIPGIISTSSFDGKIGIYNVEGCNRHIGRDGDFGSVGPLKAPKWLKRPVGALFGFGGQLVSFQPRSSSVASPSSSSEVLVHHIVTEHNLVSHSSEFEDAIHSGERSSLRVLCDKKSQECKSTDDRETWALLRVLLEDDGTTTRSKLLLHLGFSLPSESKDNLQGDLTAQVNAVGLDEPPVDNITFEGNDRGSAFITDNGEDFFNNLPSPKADLPVSPNNHNVVEESVKEPIPGELDGVEESSDPSFDDNVQRALVVGDFKGAVSLCITANRMADALIIAHLGGDALMESTRDKCLKMSQSPYLKTISAMVNKDLQSLVNTRHPNFWKETLALVITFSQEEEWSTLCNLLASKLVTAGSMLAATLCFICAGNIDKTVEIWSRNLGSEHGGKSYIDLLQDLMEKTVVFALASGQKQFSASVCKLVEKYAEILASQGLLTTATELLNLLGTDELSPELSILKERISFSAQAEKEATGMALHDGVADSAWQGGYNAPPAPSYQAPAPSYQTPAPSYQAPAPSYQAPVPSYQDQGHQPTMFVPTLTPQVPQMQPFAAPAPSAPHHATRTFVPAPPPVLKNAEQYQQPNLHSQLYPATTPTFQPLTPTTAPVSGPSPVPGARMPHVVGAAPAPGGFTPVTTQGVVHRPGMPTMQPSSPIQSTPPQPAAALAAPPPTVQTADTSKVPPHQKPVIVTLTRLFNETSEVLGGARANPAKKREIEDNSRKIGDLFAKLNNGDISKNAADKLVQLCQALDNRDFSTALQIQVLLTTSDWDECGFWLTALKRMIKTRQNVRLG
ncbi:hypothetical protein SAY87_031141 [Trapa incisa]|uniref:Uncharacterized protein n=1 Tax=Trapa incisa TaxID=236973 RepID=A0AAN7KSW1_9MYRT|nr:hypothetical protein SAY87_031141 [Trapa incisa]